MNLSKFKSKNSLLVHSLLTNGEQISDLWELDSLGIKDPSEKRSKLELQDLALKHCENTILRDDEGRYIVSIHWIEGSGKLEDHYSLAKGRLEKTVKTLKFTGRLFDYDQQAPEHLEKAAEKLKDSMYVDNCGASVDSFEELKSFQRDSTELLALGKFDLRGWRHSDIEPNFDLRDNRQESDPQEIQVLGLMWNVKEDTFSISYRETESKEEILNCVNTRQTSSTQPCSSVSNGGARLEPRAETSSHQQAETSPMQPCSSVSNGGGGLKLRAETSGHQQAETSSMQPCSSISDGEAGVEPRVETLELPDDLTSELQQPAPRRSRYGRAHPGQSKNKEKSKKIFDKIKNMESNSRISNNTS
ncbi:uncharacterized protein TNCT_254381 [Trichonephila clavata]|uniref:Uncharacterized protein n=1 Tax=Trichonephila clavata TaxID=2740835 RepID=A0A8X6KGE0_TRICU|nr:uncharacterized protein TNCT_254381 [Trichonephila clavata]